MLSGRDAIELVTLTALKGRVAHFFSFLLPSPSLLISVSTNGWGRLKEQEEEVAESPLVAPFSWDVFSGGFSRSWAAHAPQPSYLTNRNGQRAPVKHPGPTRLALGRPSKVKTRRRRRSWFEGFEWNITSGQSILVFTTTLTPTGAPWISLTFISPPSVHTSCQIK